MSKNERDGFLIVATSDAKGDRAFIRMDEGATWPLEEFIGLLEGWRETDPDRRITVRLAGEMLSTKYTVGDADGRDD